MSEESSRPSRLSQTAFDQLFEQLKNWERWGEADELGTLNLVDPAKVVDACRSVRVGRQVSLSRPLDTVGGARNPKPALHHMTSLADQGTGDLRSSGDFIGVDYHGLAVSHLDALAHMAYKGRLYNDKETSSALTSAGATHGSVLPLANGIVTRGALLDAPRAWGVPWLEAPTALSHDDLEAIVERLGMEVLPGDAVLLRTGEVARHRDAGRHDSGDDGGGLASLHPDGLAWLAAKQIAILGCDGNSDATPSTVEGVRLPMHALTLVALGMCLLDNLDLEALSATCAEVASYHFLLLVAPLVVPGGTGSPVNPIAVL